MNVNLKSLVGRLNDTCRGALEGAAGLCLSRTNYDVEIEHILAKLLNEDDTDLQKICRHYEVNVDRLTKDVSIALDRLKTGNSRTPGFPTDLPDWFQNAWLLASVDYGAARVRSGHLLLALLSNDGNGAARPRYFKRIQSYFASNRCKKICRHNGRFVRSA